MDFSEDDTPSERPTKQSRPDQGRTHSQAQVCWDIPDRAKLAIPTAMLWIVVAKDQKTDEFLYDPRVRIAAVQALVAMQRQNLAVLNDQPHEIAMHPDQQRDRLVALAQRLGVDQVVEPVPAVDASSHSKTVTVESNDAASTRQPGGFGGVASRKKMAARKASEAARQKATKSRRKKN